MVSQVDVKVAREKQKKNRLRERKTVKESGQLMTERCDSHGTCLWAARTRTEPEEAARGILRNTE